MDERKILISKIVAKINETMVPPFVSVSVRAWTNDRGDFCLKVQGRDMQVASDGTFVGCGTVLGCE